MIQWRKPGTETKVCHAVIRPICKNSLSLCLEFIESGHKTQGVRSLETVVYYAIIFQFYLRPQSNAEKAMAPHLLYSCLENLMDRGAWWAAVHGVAKSQTRLSDFTFTFMHWRRKWQPTPAFLPEESQGLGNLVGCHLWGRRVGHD